MLPITLDLTKLRIALAGEGPEALGRLESLDEARVEHLTVFAPNPSAALASRAGARLRRAWPDEPDWAAIDVLFAGDMAPEESARLYQRARLFKILVNVEDQTEWCDFHMPAVLRRGALAISVSTEGRAPGLSGLIRRFLSQIFGPEWGPRLDELSKHRAAWRADGLGQKALHERVATYVRSAGWLPGLQSKEKSHEPIQHEHNRSD